MSFVFVIPIFNRKDNLEKLLSNEDLMRDFHFVFIDDHSTDGSFEYLSSAGYDNVEVIKSSNKDSFWRGCIDDGCRYIYSEDKYKSFDFFGFMNDDIIFSNDCDYSVLRSISKEKIWFAPAYWGRKKVFTGGIKEDSKKCLVSKEIEDIKDCLDYISVGGFFTLFPMAFLSTLLSIKLPEFVKHYHADTCYSFMLKQKLGVGIQSLDDIFVIIDDSDKKRLSDMSVNQRLHDFRSPFEWKASFFWYMLVSSNIVDFVKNYSFHFIKGCFWGFYYKYRR